MPAACKARTIILNSCTDSRGVAGGTAEGGGEEGQGVVAPVIAPALLDQVAVVDVQMDRHQLHRSHAEAEQVLDGRLRGHARVGAAQLLRHVGMALGEALDVQFVDQCFVPGCPRRMVVAPGEGAVDHRRQRREGALSRSSQDRSASGSPIL